MPLNTVVGVAVMMDEIRAEELRAPQSLEELWAHNLLNEMVQVRVQPEKSGKPRIYMMRRWALRHTFNSASSSALSIPPKLMPLPDACAYFIHLAVRCTYQLDSYYPPYFKSFLHNAHDSHNSDPHIKD